MHHHHSYNACMFPVELSLSILIYVKISIHEGGNLSSNLRHNEVVKTSKYVHVDVKLGDIALYV